MLNKHFASVFSPTADINVLVRDSSILLPCVDFSSNLVYKVLLNSKPTYFSGPDSLLAIFCTNLASSLAVSISIIFSISYHFATVPCEWKCADVIPFFKKGNPSVTANYRSVSLTWTLGKVMGQVIIDNLLAYALAQNLISADNYGFMPGRSTCS